MLTRLIRHTRLIERTVICKMGMHSNASNTKQPEHPFVMEGLTARLALLGITDLPKIRSAYPDQNPLDIFRSHIAERLAPLAGVDVETVFSGLDRSTKPETGDFVLAVPRLRIKGANPQELGKKWQSQVASPRPAAHFSSASHHCWKKSFQRGHSCNSLFRTKQLFR